MEVFTLNSSNYTGLSSTYTFDDTVKFNQSTYYLEQGIGLPLAEVFKRASDTTTNNFSNLFLTKSMHLSSALYIENLEEITQDSFTTYLAVNAIGGISNASRFLVVQDVEPTVNTAAVSMSGTLSRIDNRYFFTVRLLSDSLCKVEHATANFTRYLTTTPDGEFFFVPDIGDSDSDPLNPQIFYYIYDRESDYIILAKNVQDVPFYVTYSSSITGDNLVLVQPITGTGTAYTTNSIFKCYPRQDTPNETKLYDSWVSYKKNAKTNTLDINPARSVQSVNSNLLLNNEYLTSSNDSLNLNALSLKNTNTPENYQSRNNPFQANKSLFFSESEVEMRDYKKLFTGSNQLYGNDNITVGYEAFTTDIVLRKDAVTYFHIPYNFYPFQQLNINDSGLAQAGAIAGDHPIKSDKIFKKLINAENTSPYGSTKAEANGTFLCSWLSGGTDIKVQPVWVDRYYNPSIVTASAALTSNSLQVINYTTTFESLCKETGIGTGINGVFDKPSDLIFEPGTYYAYHHYGPSDVKKYINALDLFLTDKGLPYYYSVDSNEMTISQEGDEYPFSGDRYAVTSPLSSIQNSNQFTISFDMYNSDWLKPFGYQIVGNLLGDGFGIFNQNLVTPTVFVNTTSGLNILNTDFKKIKTVSYSRSPLLFIRSRFGEDYSIVFNDGTLSRFTCDDFLLKENSSLRTVLSSAIDYINDDNTAYVLCTGSGGGRFILTRVDLNQNNVTSYTTSALSPSAYFIQGAGDVNQNLATTVDYYGGRFFFTPGLVTRRVNNDLYFLTNDRYSINVVYDVNTISTQTNIPALTAFRSAARIVDFNIDFEGNIWIINDIGAYCKYTQNKEFILSGTLTSDTVVTNTVQLTGNGRATLFTIANSGSTNASDYIVKNNKGITYVPNYDYTIVGGASGINFSSPPGLSAIYTVTRTYAIDTYKNARVDFISEFANREYINNVLFVRSNHGTAPISASGYQFAAYTTNGIPVTSVFMTSPSGSRLSLLNNNYLREYVQDAYPDTNLNVKAITVNSFNAFDTLTNEIIYNLSALDPGYHHFAVRFDAYNGYMALFVDGQRVGNVQFEPRKYKFSNLFYRPFVIGSACFNNSMPLFEYLQKNSYLVENVNIKNFYLHNIPLNDYDIIMLARNGQKIHDIHFDVACGKRSYLEEIERYFKASIPGSKSTAYNIIVRNTGITDINLRKEIENQIQLSLNDFAPVYAKLNTIKWVN